MHFSMFLAWALIFATMYPQTILASPIALTGDENGFRIPTVHESAMLARRVLRLTTRGVFSTVYPASSSAEHHGSTQAGEAPLHQLAYTPVGLMEYIADCEASGNPSILAIGIATTFQNVASGSRISLSVTWTPPYAPISHISSLPDSYDFSAANLPRFSLFGYLEPIDDKDVEKQNIEKCFIKSHPDARLWLPGNHIHASAWQRFVVQDIYWIGGFGDRAYIGWIPTETWNKVAEEDIQKIRLPGEQSSEEEWETNHVIGDL